MLRLNVISVNIVLQVTIAGEARKVKGKHEWIAISKKQIVFWITICCKELTNVNEDVQQGPERLHAGGYSRC